MMGVGTWVVAVVVVVMVGVQKPGNAFNFLPVHHPSFSGPTDSQFGFSVALWKDAKGVKRVVVGAPHGEQTWANNTFPLGVAYLCKPHLGRHDDDGGGGGGGGDCTIQPNLVPEYDQNTNNLLSSYNFTLRNYGIAVGQTIVTQKRNGSRMAVCAPRYPSFNRIDYVANNGRCFVLQDPSRVTSSKPPTNEAFKGSLAGYSAATREDILVMGGPKAYNGCGVVLAFLRDGTRFKYSSKIQSRIDSKKTKKIKKSCGDNLQGWAVQMARYEGNHSNLSIATSSPKTNNYKGQISFYPVEMKDWQPALKILEGDETGALFGYALASPDLDGDGASDLVVSAPLATHDIDDADDNMYDVGRVFIYYAPLAKGGGPRPPSILTGKTSGGRFGTSVASLGDFNDDKYEDVAVGAPYGGTEGEGVVFIYNGGSDGLNTKPKLITPSEFFPGARGFGFSLDGDLDMDDNGYPDMVIGALHSNTALLLRASPVIKLHGSIYFDPPTINIKDNLCNNTEMPGQEKLSGVCFDLVVNLTYSSVPTFAELILGYEMKLSIDKESSMKFGFSNNTDRIMLRTKMNNTIFKEENNTHSRLRVFVQRARANLNLTISATLMASVQSYMPVDLPPMLDIFTPSTFNTSSMLVCEDNTGCSTEPDLALHAFGSPVIVGKRPMTIEVNISVEVSRDPAYGITVKVDYPDHLTYQHVDAKGNTQVPECRRKTQYSHQLSCLIEEAKADEQIDFWLVFVYKIEDMEKLLEGTPFSLSVINDVKGTDPDLSNNEAEVVIQAKTKASLYPQSFSEPEGVVVVVNQTASTDDIKAAETTAATFPVDKLGPRVDHIFSLTNRGPSPVLDAKLLFQVPLYLGESMLTYFMDQPTASPGVTCTHLNVNPLRLQPPQAPVTSTLSLTTTTTSSSSSIDFFRKTSQAQPQQQREKRDVKGKSSFTTDSSTFTSSSTDPTYSSTYSSSLQWTTNPAEYFSTTYDPLRSMPTESENVLECMDHACLVTCTVNHIPAGKSASVNFSSYLVIATLNKFDIRKVFVRTWITPEVAQNGSTVINSNIPATLEVSLIRPPKSGLFSALPMWLLILTIVLAILIIAIIVCALWKAGFFNRKRPPAEYRRESVIPEFNLNYTT